MAAGVRQDLRALYVVFAHHGAIIASVLFGGQPVKRVRTVYGWTGQPGEGTLERVGSISEAKLRAWEYSASGAGWEFASGDFHDTVRAWKTARPDLAPAMLLVGEQENATS